ncbi:hypothetical protein J2S17_005279 [Cytobacillus purgationiresistens]|uniref:Uncharacterized protein n=1 Tax=Cytobacillus purgationiresistens TaxID=863449 RepID=A0ABU0AQ17_9BACI|nr:hypothetical protein [Cytobacillus purgationiresistens]
MKSIPYFHYKRVLLKEYYAEDYERLKPIYEDGLSAWLQEWERYINTQYREAI